MVKDKRVSLWLGFFESREVLNEYITCKYDEDGNRLFSAFQGDYEIGAFDEDAIETDWLSEQV